MVRSTMTEESTYARLRIVGVATAVAQMAENSRKVTERRSEQDMFFSGDVQGKNVTLPGIRHNGSCEILSDDRSMPSYVQSHANFVDACDKRNWFTMNTELLNVSYYVWFLHIYL